MWNRWKHLWHDTKGYFWAGIGLMALSAVAGYLWANTVESLVHEMLTRVKELAERVKESGTPTALFWVIFVNNLSSALLMMIMGLFFAVFPVFSIISNGLLLGYVLAQMNTVGVDPVQMFLVGILPHGILELPAVVFAAAMGVRYGVLVIRSIGSVWRPERRAGIVLAWKAGVRQFPVAVLVVFVFLLAAALVESFVTPSLLHHVVGGDTSAGIP